MATNANPFFFGRSEHEKKPTIFVPDNMPEWAREKPIRFEGATREWQEQYAALLDLGSCLARLTNYCGRL